MSGPRTTRTVPDRPASTASRGREQSSDPLGACRDAEDMVASARALRREAADRAADAVNEARRVADQLHEQVDHEFARAREDFAGWSADRYATAESLAAEIVESAHKEAAAIRADALTSAIGEAEVSARAYAARRLRDAAAEAGALHDRARSVMLRSIGLIEAANGLGHRALSRLAGTLDSLDEDTATIRGLATEVGSGAASASVELAEAPAPVRLLVPDGTGGDTPDAASTRSGRASAAAAIRRTAPGIGAATVGTESLLQASEAS